MKKAHEQPGGVDSSPGGNFKRLSYTRNGEPPVASPRVRAQTALQLQKGGAHAERVTPQPVSPSPSDNAPGGGGGGGGPSTQSTPLREPESASVTPASAPPATARIRQPPPPAAASTPSTAASSAATAATATAAVASVPEQRHVRALGQYNDGFPTASSGALAFSCGDVLSVLGDDLGAPGFWKAKNESTNAFGSIPSQETCEAAGCRGFVIPFSFISPLNCQSPPIFKQLLASIQQ
jgi:hypothetical protein